MLNFQFQIQRGQKKNLPEQTNAYMPLFCSDVDELYVTDKDGKPRPVKTIEKMTPTIEKTYIGVMASITILAKKDFAQNAPSKLKHGTLFFAIDTKQTFIGSAEDKPVLLGILDPYDFLTIFSYLEKIAFGLR